MDERPLLEQTRQAETLPDERGPFAVLAVDSQKLAWRLTYLVSSVLNETFVTCRSSQQFRQSLSDAPAPSVLILEIADEAPDKLEIIRIAKAAANPPVVLALVPLGETSVSVAAFQAGADDVLYEPLAMRDFAARLLVRADADLDWRLLAQDETWDCEALLAGQAGLTSVQAKIFHILFEKAGSVATRDDLSQAIDHRTWSYGNRKFDVHVAEIRKKLQARFGTAISIRTIRAEGYLLTLRTDLPVLEDGR